MKSVLSAALFGALLAGPAFAAGMEQQGQAQQPQPGEQAQMQQQQQQQQQPEQAVSQDFLRNVQQHLQQEGYQVGQSDGIWGQQTEDALRQYQQDQGIDAQGKLNVETLASLGIVQPTQQAQTPGQEAQQPQQQPLEQQQQEIEQPELQQQPQFEQEEEFQ